MKDNSSVQLFLMKGRDLSHGNASGMVVDTGERKFILTVAHMLPENDVASMIQPVAFVDCGVVEGKSMIGVLPLGVCPVYANICCLRTDGIPEESDPCLDFTFFEVDKNVGFSGFGKNAIVHVKEFSPPFDIDLNCKDYYSFHGAIKAEPCGHFDEGSEILIWDTRKITGLHTTKIGKSYVRFEPDDKSQFRDVEMKGTSGAPIFDQFDRPVALVVSGSEEEGYVIGLRLDKAWKVLLDTINGVLAPKQLSVADYERIMGSSIYENIRGYRQSKE